MGRFESATLWTLERGTRKNNNEKERNDMTENFIGKKVIVRGDRS